MSSTEPTSPESAESRARSSVAGGGQSFAAYLGQQLAAVKRFRPGAPDEAAELAKASDVILTLSEVAFAMACVIDRGQGARGGDAEKGFAVSREQVLEVGRACLKYAGRINGAQMPVVITLYEITGGPPSEDDRARLGALQKTFPGLGKVSIHCFHVDVRSGTVWSSAPLRGLLQGRRWLERLLREPRQQAAEIFVPDAVLPEPGGWPIATGLVIAFLVAIFAVEQRAMVGSDAGSGLLGVDPDTLFALGGMNANAVLQNGEWYRLLSAALLHGDAIHLLLNGVVLGLAGYVLESLLGRAWLLSLFVLGGLGGSLLGLVVNPANIVSVGASGAVMGLLAAALVAAQRFPPGAKRIQIQLRMLQFLIPSLIPLATHRHGGSIDFAAHFGGAISGALAGLVLLKIWPRDAPQPRFQRATQGVAVASVAALAASLVLATNSYPTYTAEISTAKLLAPDSAIPDDVEVAKREVEQWGKDHPRDPRVHLFRALRLLDDDNRAGAEKELRSALGEREILETAFESGRIETALRSMLGALLLEQGRRDEAKQVAEPLCKAEGGSAPKAILDLGVCD